MNLIRKIKLYFTSKGLDRLDDLYKSEGEIKNVRNYCFKQLGQGDILKGTDKYHKEIFGTHRDELIELHIRLNSECQVIMDYIKYLEAKNDKRTN